MTRVRHLVEAAGFRLLLALASRLPRRVAQAVGTLLGRLGHALAGRRRRLARANLRQAFGPALDEQTLGRITRDCFRHFGRITVDTLLFPRLGPHAVGRLVRYEGLEHLRRAWARGRGVLLFSGHYGHWELTAVMQGFLGMPLTLVTRPLDNPRLEALLLGLRGVSGNRVIHKRRAVREMLRTLDRGGGVAIVIDQDARSEGIFVPFFGRPASTTPTLATLALRSGAAVVPTFSLPEPDGSWLVVYEPEVEFVPSGERERDVHELTARCTAIIEAWVRRRPELWLWMHERWKSSAIVAPASVPAAADRLPCATAGPIAGPPRGARPKGEPR
jgi:KDO2-lipid IV(A) lauroyltransferase